MNTEIRNSQKTEKQNRNILKGIRLTEEEAAILKEEAAREYLSECAWIRMKMFDTEHEYIPFEVRSIFDRYVYDFGKNMDKISTVTKESKMHMSIDAYDLHRLNASISELKGILTEVHECLKEVLTKDK